MMWNGGPGPLLLPVMLIASGMAVIVALVLVGPRRRVAMHRLGVADAESGLTRSAGTATQLITQVVEHGGRGRKWALALERAGIRRALPEFIVLSLGGAAGGAALGFVIGSPALGILLFIGTLGGVVGFVSFRAGHRRSKFADQLDDLSQLLATNLRAGHSILQSLSSLASELDEPASQEIQRAVNQVRLGRDLGAALEETAMRMDSTDFSWVAQAITIHRQVGGNLADVLDTVGETIRERGQLRRQVKALSAEGRMSAGVLIVLPIAVGVILSVVNPMYLTTFTQSFLGWIMLGLCFVLMLIGTLWLRVLIRVDF